MQGDTLQRIVRVQDPQGFHFRPLAQFAEVAKRFQCSLFVIKGDQKVNGKSPMELMMLAAEQGTELTIEATGPDAKAALDAIEEFMKQWSAETAQP